MPKSIGKSAPPFFCAFWQRCRFQVRPLSMKKHLRNDRSRFGDAKFKIILPLIFAKANAAAILNGFSVKPCRFVVQ